MTFRLRTIAIATVTLLLATPGFAEGATKSPPVTKVAASLVRKINGTTCAYLPTSKKTTGLKNSWAAGSKKGSKGFTTYAAAATFYKSKGLRYRTNYRQALSNSKLGSENCKRLTSLKFKTTGIVGAALATVPKITKKSIHTMTASKVAIAGLYGITPGGQTASIISAISSKDEVAVQSTSITRVYQSSDGALVIHYASHPNSCVIGKVPVGADSETCVVLKSDLPAGFMVMDAGGAVTDNTELVQFDQVGGMYLNIAGLAEGIGCETEFRNRLVETIFAVHADRRNEVLVPSSCSRVIENWAPLDNGGVVYAQQSSTSGGTIGGTINLWQNGQRTLLKDGLSVAPNGIHSMPGGKIVIFVFQFDQGFSPSSSGSQGGVLVYDQTTGSLVNWLHLRSNNPDYATEDVFAACGCTASTLYASGGTSNGGELFGVTSGSITTYNQAPGGLPTTRGFPIAVRLYPTVSMLTQLPAGYTSVRTATMSVATENSMVVAGPDYLTCSAGKDPVPCTYQMGIVDLSDNTYAELVSPTDGIATLTLSAQTDGNLVLTQSVRVSDGRYLIGIVDQTSKTITWSETSTVSYRFITALKK